MQKPIWEPSPERVEKANLTRFREFVNRRHALGLVDYPSLYQWSVDASEDFWSAVWDFTGVVASARGDTVVLDGDRFPAPGDRGARWFPEARLNFAENLLSIHAGRPECTPRANNRCGQRL